VLTLPEEPEPLARDPEHPPGAGHVRLGGSDGLVALVEEAQKVGTESVGKRG
jgi:hypothetical protein